MDTLQALQREVENLIEKFKIELKNQGLQSAYQSRPIFWPKVKNFIKSMVNGPKQEHFGLESYSQLKEQAEALTNIIINEFDINSVDSIVDKFKSNLNSILFKYFRRQQASEEEEDARSYLNKLNIPDYLKNKDVLSTLDTGGITTKNTMPMSSPPKEEPIASPIANPEPISPEPVLRNKPSNRKTKFRDKLKQKSKPTDKAVGTATVTPAGKKRRSRKNKFQDIPSPKIDHGPIDINMPNVDPHDETMGGLFGP